MAERTKNTLAIKQIKLFLEETAAQDYLMDLIKDLDECDENTNLKDKIGVTYVKNMPEFVILKNEADFVKRGLRKLCAGEISVAEALKKAEEMLESVEKALELCNVEKINAEIIVKGGKSE